MQKQIEDQESNELNKAFIADESKQPIPDTMSQLQRSISTISREFTPKSQCSFSMDGQQYFDQWSIEKCQNAQANKRQRVIIQEDVNESDSEQLKEKYTMRKKLIVGKGKIYNIIQQKNRPYNLRSSQKNLQIMSSGDSDRDIRQIVDQIQQESNIPEKYLLSRSTR